jgi:hypothetical protein
MTTNPSPEEERWPGTRSQTPNRRLHRVRQTDLVDRGPLGRSRMDIRPDAREVDRPAGRRSADRG